MCTWGGLGMGWGMGWGMLGMWLFIALVMAGMWAWARRAHRGVASPDSAGRLLRERFARGEIDSDTFDRMAAHLTDVARNGPQQR